MFFAISSANRIGKSTSVSLGVVQSDVQVAALVEVPLGAFRDLAQAAIEPHLRVDAGDGARRSTLSQESVPDVGFVVVSSGFAMFRERFLRAQPVTYDWESLYARKVIAHPSDTRRR